MQPEDRTMPALWDMVQFAQQAIRVTSRISFEKWMSDEVAVLAVEHVVQTIGEAATRVSKEFQAQHPEVPWSQIIGMRHIIVHGYDVLELDEVWNAATLDADALIHLLTPLLQSIPPETPDDLTP